MAQRNRYRELGFNMTRIILADAVVFLLYLLFAGYGITPLKIITAIVAIIGSILCLGFLHLVNELKRRRSLWMVTAFAAIALCTLVSLLTNMPSPA